MSIVIGIGASSTAHNGNLPPEAKAPAMISEIVLPRSSSA